MEIVADASLSQKFTKAKRNWFANAHSKLNPEQGGRSLVGTTKTRHLHEKESGGHKERASLIEPMLMLSISMGRVNFAKGNWVFLSCLPWGYKQIHEFETEAATFGSSSFALTVNCGGKSLGSPKRKNRNALCTNNSVSRSLWAWPLAWTRQLRSLLTLRLGKLTRQKQKQCAVDSEHTLVSFPHRQ